MKIALSWIKEFIDLDLSAEKIAEALTLAGLEEEGMERVGDDVIFDIGLTPNLGHCMSIVGMARELSAILELPLKRKEFSFEELSGENDVAVVVEGEGCSRYCCRLVRGVKVGTSPDWLKQRLESCGVRSRNNVVDVGNFVMLELGQPLHMFDYQKISEKKIVVKSGLEGQMVTLDEVERQIPEEALMIFDGDKPVAFAGVMGSLDSAVEDGTVDVLIEAAHFSDQAVRKTSKLLNLRSDSSLRFERGIDPLRVDLALDHAAMLLGEVAGGKIAKGLVDVITKEYEPVIVEMNPEQCNRILGTNLSIHEMAGLLQRLEIEILEESEDVIRVSVPSYRNDLRAEIDLIEEVGRMYGFNNIPRRFPRHVSSTITHAPLFLFEEEARAKLVEQGLQECLTCDLISPELADLAAESARGKEALISVLHPASVDQSVLRPSLLPGLLEVVKFNLDRQNANLALFEVGHIHFKDKDEFFGEPAAAIVLTGKSDPHHFEKKPDDVDFFELKGHVEDLLSSLGMEGRFETSHLHSFHPGRQAHVFIGDLMIGGLGEVHPKHCRAVGISQSVYYAELNLHDLMDLKKEIGKVEVPSSYPGSERDWTINLEDKLPIEEVLSSIRRIDSPLLENVFLLDLYKSDKIGKDRKNATFRLTYRDKNKTIAYEDVEKEHKRIISSVEKKLEDVIR